MICPSCGEAVADGQRFCGACGASLARTCSSCGTENPASFRFCGGCGAGLADDAPSTTESPLEERRWATVLFADLSGFTSLSERSDVEDVRALVDRCMAKLGSIAEELEGTVDSVSGDQIMVVFGAPVAHEDDPDRAVRCALEMIHCAEVNAAEFGGLPLRIGVNTGEMMFAPVGPQGARQHTLMGDAVNVAARLQTAAPPGGVLVGEQTYAASRHAIAYDGPTDVQAKGKEEPVKAWLAKDVVAAPAERPVSTAPMIGRDAVLGQLHTIWKRVRADQRPHLVTVLGLPGVGKTRLSQELATIVQEQGGRVVRGRSQPYGELLGYGAFAQQVKSVAGIRDTDPPEEARARLTSFLGELGIEAEDVAEQVAVLIGLVDRPVADRQMLFYAARLFVERLAASQPTLLLFEDIHWSDPSLLDLITSLAGRVRDAPVMLLTLARPELLERAAAWGGGLTSYTALPLSPLSDQDTLELVHRLAPEIAAPIARQIAETAAGNPLFIEELASSLQEGRVGAELPTSVKTLIASRIDALPRDQRRLILDASVLGKVFWRGALQLMSDGAVTDTLDALESRDLIRREPASRIAGDVEYTFRHILIREVAYATLPRATRRDRHAAVARFLEQAAGERSSEWATTLAHHWQEASETERALEYLLVAAEQASHAWAKGEAVRLYAQALDLLASEDPRRSQLRIRRAALLVEAGDLVPAVSELDEMLETLEGKDRLQALLWRARAAYWVQDTDTQMRVAAQAEALAEEVHQPELTAGVKMVSLEATAMQGRLGEVVEIGPRTLADPEHAPRGEARALMQGLVGLAHYWLGNAEAAEELSLQAHRAGLELHSVEATIVGGTHLAMAVAAQARHTEAFALFEQVVAQARELELVPRLTSRAMNAWAGALADVGDTGRAWELNAEGVEMATRTKFPNGRSQGLVDQVFWHIAQDDPGRAEAMMPELFELAAKLRGWHEWLIEGRLAAAKAEVLLARQRFDEAAEAARRSADISARVGRAKYVSRSRVTLGRALLRLGRSQEAVDELRAALAAAEQIRHARSEWAAASALREAHSKMGNDAGAEEADANARRSFERFTSSLSPEQRARLEDVGARI